MHKFKVKTLASSEMADITAEVQGVVAESGTETGVCQWVRASPRVQSWFPAIARILTGPRATSATAQVLAEGGALARLRAVQAPLETWFPGLQPATRDAGPVLTEQAIPLGRHGVLTVLSSPAWGDLAHFAGDATGTP